MMNIATAGQIVFRAAQRLNIAHPDIDSSLEDIGLISVKNRIVFREFVHSGVLNEGFKISKADIPAEANTTLREIVEAVSARALPGDPTTGDDHV